MVKPVVIYQEVKDEAALALKQDTFTVGATITINPTSRILATYSVINDKTAIIQGDLLIVQSNDGKIHAHIVAEVKEVDGDEEVILKKAGNVWFSRNRYHEGLSWIKEVRLVTP